MKIIDLNDIGVDVDSLLEYVGDDENIARFALNMFLEDTTYAKVVKAKEDNDVDMMIKSIHELKGVLSALFAKPIISIVIEILTKLRESDFSDMDILYKQLDEEYLKLTRAIKNIE